VARVLISRPDLAVRVRGRVADADLLRLQDEAALSALVEVPAAEPLRAVLRARLAGLPPPSLDEPEQRRLEDLIGGLPWPGQPLHDLAVDRGAVVAARLILDHKLEAERVSTDLPDVPERGRLAASPSVDVELQAR